MRYENQERERESMTEFETASHGRETVIERTAPPKS